MTNILANYGDLRFVEFVYRFFLQRKPNPHEIAAVTASFQNGMSRLAWIAEIMNSREFQSLAAELEVDSAETLDIQDEVFLENAYRELLHREIDQVGKASNLALLRDGFARSAILKKIVVSSELTDRISSSRPLGRKQSTIIPLKPTNYKRIGEFLVFLSTGPEDYDWLERMIIENGYYEGAGSWGYDINQDKRMLAEFIREFEPKKALEIGCSSGAVMKCLWELGVYCEGVEISSYARRMAYPEVAHLIHQGDLLDLDLPRVYDVIFGMDVFEHFNPNKLPRYIHRVRNLLTEGGRLVINVPAIGDDDVFGLIHGYWLNEWRSLPTDSIYSFFPTDELGYPLSGHLVWAHTTWWEAMFAEHSFLRDREFERRLHQKFDNRMSYSAARKSYYVFAKR
jgi:hypothetical protein